MLISNCYYTYKYQDRNYVWWDANVVKTDINEIFDMEIININKELWKYWMVAIYNNQDKSSNFKRWFEIFISDDNINYEDHYLGFWYVNIKNI